MMRKYSTRWVARHGGAPVQALWCSIQHPEISPNLHCSVENMLARHGSRIAAGEAETVVNE